MREQLKLTGMVLSAVPIGEYDKRVVVLTKRERLPRLPEGTETEWQSFGGGEPVLFW